MASVGPLNVLIPGLVLGLAAAAGWDWLAFAGVGVLAALLVRSRPALVTASLLVLGPADLLLAVDAGGFTFRAGHLVAVVLAAHAATREGVRAYARWVLGSPGLAWLGLLVVVGAVHVGQGVPNPGKAAGYVAWGIFDVVVLAPAVAWHVRRHAPGVALRWWWGAALVALFGMTQFVLPQVGAEPFLVRDWVGNRARVNALSYEASYFAFQAIIPLALACGLSARGLLRNLAPAAALTGGILGLALVLSSSRSAWGGMVILLCMYGIARAVFRFRRRAGADVLPAWALLGAVLVLGAAWLPPHAFAGDRILAERALDLSDPSSAQPRREGIAEAINLFRLRPVTGWGPGQFGGALLANPSARVRVLRPEEEHPDSLVTYNLYAELLCEAGAVGTGAFLLALVSIAWSLWRARARPGTGAWAWATLWPLLLSFGAMYQFNQTLWRVEAWCLVGLAWAFGRRRQP